MNALQIAATVVGLVISGCMTGFIVWAVRKINGSMQRDEHERVCDKKNAEIKACLREQNERVDTWFSRIEQRMKDSDSHASQSRHDLRGQIGTLSSRVAVLDDRSRRIERHMRISMASDDDE